MADERWTNEMLDELASTVKDATVLAQENSTAIRQLREETKEQSIRFAAYQQASQWVVNLAFGLLATATITTIVTAVLRR